jgi:DNA-binding NarL/FixJ family response regulator
VLVLSAYDDDVYVHDMLALGVVGYLLKDEMPETVVKAVRTVMQGGAWFSPPIKEKMRQVGSGKADQAKEPNLSDQDRDILKLMAAGLDNARIATQVNLAEKTVRNYLSRIYRELGVHSDREAIAWLKEHSWA